MFSISHYIYITVLLFIEVFLTRGIINARSLLSIPFIYALSIVSYIIFDVEILKYR